MTSRSRTIAIGALLLLSVAVPSSAVLKPGDALIPFALKNVDGTEYAVVMENGRLTLLTTREVAGKPETVKTHPDAVLLDFWATWCVPCRASMPYMQKFHETYGAAEGRESGGLRLFGVAIDQRGALVVKPFYAKLKITYPMLCAPTEGPAGDGLVRTTKEMQSRYAVQEIPVVYVIDAKGKITHAHVGFKTEHVAELDAAIRALVKPGSAS